MSVISCLREKFEQMYFLYNRRKYVNPDPLMFLYSYPNLQERELAGLIASCLAYGNVKQILKSVSKVLAVMGNDIHDYVTFQSSKDFMADFKGFKHRFTTDVELVAFFTGIKKVIEKYGSLYKCFLAGYDELHDNVFPALVHFVKELKQGENVKNSLLPDPERKSACKRLFLFLRWMVRKDDVDPGGWDFIPLSKLVVPLDTHMYKIASALKMTTRKSADFKCALEITNGFKSINKADPVKYDFALTRMGIHDDFNINAFLNECKVLSE